MTNHDLPRWTYFSAEKPWEDRDRPSPALIYGRYESADPEGTCQVLSPQGHWEPSELLRRRTAGEIRRLDLHMATVDALAELVTLSVEAGRIAALPEDLAPRPRPQPAARRWLYLVFARPPRAGSALHPSLADGRNFIEWLKKDVPLIPRGESILRHDDLFVGRSDLDRVKYNLQSLRRDGTWRNDDTWERHAWFGDTTFLPLEISTELARDLILDGYDVGYYQYLPDDLPS